MARHVTSIQYVHVSIGKYTDPCDSNRFTRQFTRLWV